MIDGKHLTKPPKDWQPQVQDSQAGTAYIEVTASSDPEHGEVAPTGSALASGRSASRNLAFCLTFTPETARVVGELMQVWSYPNLIVPRRPPWGRWQSWGACAHCCARALTAGVPQLPLRVSPQESRRHVCFHVTGG